jgi:broad specificity phosphatase PhoE
LFLPVDDLEPFFFVRHGETTANVMGIVQGHSDFALNDHGKNQAEAIATLLEHLPLD